MWKIQFWLGFSVNICSPTMRVYPQALTKGGPKTKEHLQGKKNRWAIRPYISLWVCWCLCLLIKLTVWWHTVRNEVAYHLGRTISCCVWQYRAACRAENWNLRNSFFFEVHVTQLNVLADHDAGLRAISKGIILHHRVFRMWSGKCLMESVKPLEHKKVPKPQTFIATEDV